jgi:hypothetical protein
MVNSSLARGPVLLRQVPACPLEVEVNWWNPRCSGLTVPWLAQQSCQISAGSPGRFLHFLSLWLFSLAGSSFSPPASLALYSPHCLSLISPPTLGESGEILICSSLRGIPRVPGKQRARSTWPVLPAVPTAAVAIGFVLGKVTELLQAQACAFAQLECLLAQLLSVRALCKSVTEIIIPLLKHPFRGWVW